MVVQFVAFVGAPYVERLRSNHTLSAALTGITAAVVGIIANLAVLYAVHTLFAGTNEVRRKPVHLELPELATIKPVSVGIAVFAAVLLFRLKWSVLRTLALCAAFGVLAGLASLA
jgi:chromate transporter